MHDNVVLVCTTIQYCLLQHGPEVYMIYRAINCKREWDTELLVNSQGIFPSLSLDNAQASEAKGVVSLDMVLSCEWREIYQCTISLDPPLLGVPLPSA